MTGEPEAQPSPQVGVRLQKVLAQAGVASRRHCEDLMAAGRVEVDGEVVTQLGARVDPETAVIRVNGARIPIAAACTPTPGREQAARCGQLDVGRGGAPGPAQRARRPP